jgi:MFS family permease
MNEAQRDVNPYQPPLEGGVAVDAGELAAPRHGAPATLVRYLVLAALCLAALVAYVQRNSIGVAEESMRLELGLSKSEMGLAFSAFFLAYALLQIPSGIFGQLAGTRRGLSLVMGLSSLVGAAMCLVTNLPLLLATRIGMGAAQAGVFPCSIPTVRSWIPEARRSLATGMLGSFMSVGGALGAMLMGVLLPTIGWRAAFVLFALPGFAFAVLFFVWFRDRPEQHAAVNDAERELIRRGTQGGRARAAAGSQASGAGMTSDEGRLTNDLTLAASKGQSAGQWLWALLAIGALCGQQAFRGAAYIFFASWFATFLRETRGVGDMAAGALNGLPLLAVVIGSPAGGLLSDLVLSLTGSLRWSRQGVATFGMLSCAVLMAVSMLIANVWLAVLVISAGSFFSAFGGPCAYAATIDMGGRHAPTVFSTMNMMGNFGAFLFPMAVPLLLQVGVPAGKSNWSLVLLVFAAMFVGAALCWLMADGKATVDPRNDQ